MKKAIHLLSLLALATLADLAHAQSCASAYAPSYRQSYSQSYSYAPAVSYGAPTYYAPTVKKTYAYQEDYVRTRFILALPVIDLGAVAAAYVQAPQQQAPAPQAKATGQESQMQQILSSQGQILDALKKLDDRTRAVEQRLEKLERSREPFKAPRPEEQGPPPKEEPTGGDVDRAFAAVDAASCAACHRRGNEKYGGGFVFSEADGRMAKLSADQREEVERQITSGKMPRMTGDRAKQAGVKALAQATADVLFKALDRQKLAARTARKEQGAE